MVAFDYTPLNGSAKKVREAVGRIREWVSACEHHARSTGELAVKIGNELLAVKNMLPHGLWGHWLRDEFQWTDRHARRYMAIASRFKTDIMSDLGVSVLDVLAGGSVPEAAVKEAISRSEAGEKVTVAKAKAIVAKHSPEKATEAKPSKAQPENRISENLKDVYPEPEPQKATESAAEPSPPGPPSELELMREILKLAAGLSLENLGKVREAIDRLHDGKCGKVHIRAEKAPSVSQEPVVLAPEPQVVSPSSGLISFDPADLKPPAKLDDPRFRKAWREWVEYNAEEGHPLKESVATKQMAELAARSLDAAIVAIDKAISTRSKAFPAAKHARPKFQQPTVDEVRQYCSQTGISGKVDPERFCSYYEAQGWKLSNGQPMSDWKAAARNWAGRREEERASKAKGTAAVDGAYKKYEPERRRPVNAGATGAQKT